MRAYLPKLLRIPLLPEISNFIDRRATTFRLSGVLKAIKPDYIRIISDYETGPHCILRFDIYSEDTKYNITLKYSDKDDMDLLNYEISCESRCKEEENQIQYLIDNEYSIFEYGYGDFDVMRTSKRLGFVDMESLIPLIENRADFPTMDWYTHRLQQINLFMTPSKVYDVYYTIKCTSKYKTIDNAELLNLSRDQVFGEIKSKTIDRLPYDICSEKIYKDTSRVMHGNTTIITTYGNWFSCSKKVYAKSNGEGDVIEVHNAINTNEKSEMNINPGDNSVKLLVIDNKEVNLDEMIGYKIVTTKRDDDLIECLLVLRIPKEARVASRGEKHRCDKATPIQVFIPEGDRIVEYKTQECYSAVHTTEYTYTIDVECVIDDFNPDLSRVCVPGIHFQWSLKTAITTWGHETWKDITSFELN